jgi:hypothetical protein
MPQAKKQVTNKVAKKKVEKASVKASAPKSEEIVINLDTILIPGAIILAGVIIALSIFITNKGNSKTTTDTVLDQMYLLQHHRRSFLLLKQ